MPLPVESLSLPPLPRRNGSKIDSCSSCVMPGPVSITLRTMPCRFPSRSSRHDALQFDAPLLGVMDGVRRQVGQQPGQAHASEWTSEPCEPVRWVRTAMPFFSDAGSCSATSAATKGVSGNRIRTTGRPACMGLRHHSSRSMPMASIALHGGHQAFHRPLGFRRGRFAQIPTSTGGAIARACGGVHNPASCPRDPAQARPRRGFPNLAEITSSSGPENGGACRSMPDAVLAVGQDEYGFGGRALRAGAEQRQLGRNRGDARKVLRALRQVTAGKRHPFGDQFAGGIVEAVKKPSGAGVRDRRGRRGRPAFVAFRGPGVPPSRSICRPSSPA